MITARKARELAAAALGPPLDEQECVECHQSYFLRDRHEPTALCDLCAHEYLALLAGFVHDVLAKESARDNRVDVNWEEDPTPDERRFLAAMLLFEADTKESP